MAVLTADEAIDQALAHHAAGYHDSAEAGLRSVLITDPDNADALNLLGLLLQEKGQYRDSIALISKALAIDPQFPEALTNLARVQHATGDLPAAIQSAERALELDPDLNEAALQLARSLLDSQRGADAEPILRRSLLLRPACPDATLNLGSALLQQEKHAEALLELETVLRLHPTHTEAIIKSGVALCHLNRLDEALTRHKQAVDLAPHLADTHAALALTLRQRQDPLASSEACRAALQIVPDRADLWLLLSSNLSFIGQFDEAAECNQRALLLNPRSAEAWRERTMIGQVATTEGMMYLQSILEDSDTQVQERITAGFTLGQLLDKANAYDAAFAAYAATNRRVHKNLGQSNNTFDLAGFHRHVDWLIETFNPSLFEQSKGVGNPSDHLVFIVGMPRSGTTLVEQIAASHARVFGAGERKDIHDLVSRLSGPDLQVSPRDWSADMACAVATEHVARITALGGTAARIIDKMPDNILFLGHIAVLFPNARIILCRRDLRDVCLSAFFQQFGDGMNWTSDLADCAARAQEIERLVSHWQSVLPQPILEVGYQDLVSDLEGQTRRLIAFLGLDWDPACLTFHQTQRPVMTASYWQVRQPIYTASCGRWQQYRRHVAPLLLGLAGLVPPPESDDWDRILLDPDIAIRAAMVHSQMGRLAVAEQIYQHLRQRYPNYPLTLQLLANPPGPVTALGCCPAVGDGRIDAHAKLGLALRPPGHLSHTHRALERDPRSPPGLLPEPKLPTAASQADHAEYQKCAVEVRPAQLEVLNDRAGSVAALGRYEEAIEIQRRTVECYPGNPLALYQLAWLLWRSQDPTSAIEACETGIDLAPGQADFWLLLANCRMQLGHFIEAARCFRQALSLDPSSGVALSGLLQAGEAGQSDDILKASIGVVAQEKLPVEQRVSAAFAIARYHEKREDYDAAFAGFTAANVLAQTTRIRGGDKYESLRQYVDWAIRTFRPETFRNGGVFANCAELPCYIVGMPRSGTTLVEQIAASHPSVFGEGERPDLELLLGQARGQFLSTAPTEWNKAAVRQITDILLATLRQRGGNAVRVINKLPNNILWLGQIALLFPNARIIICRRDLRDVCLSCYSQNFLDPEMAWTDTLEGCARQAKEINRLLDHWGKVLPTPALEIQYETLVGDLEGQSRRLTDHLGVDWDPACLKFHQTGRTVMTASLWQVRQPLYGTSVGKWRHYRNHLGPIFKALRGLIPEND